METPKIYLEHANISVNNIQQAKHFFQIAFPHFKIRGGGNETREWIHFGDENTYIAITQAEKSDEQHEKNYSKTGINHIGFVVENVEQLANRLLAENYQRSFPKQVEEFRIRDYFFDADGNEYEFVQYLSENPEEKNRY